MDSYAESEGFMSPASWMKVSFGIKSGFSEEDAQALKGRNAAVLNAVVLGVTGTRNVLHFPKGVLTDEQKEQIATEPFYMTASSNLATTADRVRALEKLADAMGGETLASLMAPRFLAMFSKVDIIEQLKVRAPSLRVIIGMDASGLSPFMRVSVPAAVRYGAVFDQAQHARPDC